MTERHRPSDPPEGIGDVVRALLGEGRMRRGISLGRLTTSWEAVVGPELARETVPTALDQGGLLVTATSSGWGTQVRFLADQIRRRANEVLGGDEVRRVSVVVAPTGRKPLRRNATGPEERRGGTSEEAPSEW